MADGLLAKEPRVVVRRCTGNTVCFSAVALWADVRQSTRRIAVDSIRYHFFLRLYGWCAWYASFGKTAANL